MTSSHDIWMVPRDGSTPRPIALIEYVALTPEQRNAATYCTQADTAFQVPGGAGYCDDDVTEPHCIVCGADPKDCGHIRPKKETTT